MLHSYHVRAIYQTLRLQKRHQIFHAGAQEDILQMYSQTVVRTVEKHRTASVQIAGASFPNAVQQCLRLQLHEAIISW